jgi:hypothetical protein
MYFLSREKNLRLQHCRTIHFSLREEMGVRLPAKIVCHDINNLFLLARLFLQKPFLRQGCARLHW